MTDEGAGSGGIDGELSSEGVVLGGEIWMICVWYQGLKGRLRFWAVCNV